MQSLRVGVDDDEDSHPHNDCFVAVNSPSQLLVSEPNSRHHHASSSSDRIDNSSDVVETDEQLTSSLPTRLHISIPDTRRRQMPMYVIKDHLGD